MIKAPQDESFPKHTDIHAQDGVGVKSKEIEEESQSLGGCDMPT